MNKHRWAQLSGMTPEEPVLMLEGNVPFYREDLKELVQEEIKKALADSKLQADQESIDAARVTQFTTGVTTNGTPGSSGAYTQIVVSETTPNILYYQCSSHALMGSRIDIDSSTSVIASATAFVDSTGTAINFASTNFAIAQAVALG